MADDVVTQFARKAGLTRHQAEVVLLSELGLSRTVIAKALGVSDETNVSKTLTRARKRQPGLRAAKQSRVLPAHRCRLDIERVAISGP